eukprot:TRINITY_DN28546_c0_g1_i1.p1 TRINITY_DN28546_c0_g1~~TRINITY_DN28546_c0_g1_i1.p1  ORF type:complete len:244 (+),score=39.71 TRINITY_DN28546_c0_g1_i1:49-780(+)
MIVYITCPGSRHREVEFTVGQRTIVEDAIKAVGEEWDVDITTINLTYESDVLPGSSLISSLGLPNGAGIFAVLTEKKVFTKDDFRKGKVAKTSALFEANPDKICILDASTMNNYGRLETTFNMLPPSVKNVAFTNCEFVKEIGGFFLCGSAGLTSVDFSALSGVTSIGSYFLSDCCQIATVNLAPLNKVTSIGEGFLSKCTSLTNLDMNPLTRLQRVSTSRFMDSCPAWNPESKKMFLSTINQ